MPFPDLTDVGVIDVAKPKKISIVRNAIGLVALVAIAAVSMLELRARFEAIQMVKRLEEAQADFETNRFAPALTKERVQIILGRPPAGPVVKEGQFEKQIYVWKGVFRRYTLSTYFLGDGPSKLENFGVD